MLTIKEGTPAEKVWSETPKETQDIVLKSLENAGHIVRTKDQDKEYVKSQVQTEADKVYKKHQDQVDATVFEITGIQKNAEEKTSDYQKRAITEKLKVVKDLETQINELKTKGVDGNALAAELKQQKDQLQQLMQTKEKEWSEKYTGLQTQVFTTEVNNNVDKVVAEYKSKMRADIDPALVPDIIAARLAKFHSENKASQVEGVLVWKDKEGTTRIAKTNGAPQTTAEVLEGYFADLFDKGKQGGGAGSGKPGEGGKGGDAKWKSLTLPAEVKSKAELYKWLTTEHKMDDMSKDFNEAYTALGKDLPIERKN